MDITSLVQDWVTTPSGNRGLLLRPTAGGATLTYDLASANHWTASLRPKLTITYTVPTGLAAYEAEVKVEAKALPQAPAAVVVTKYYYLGNTRVAMRKADALYYLFGDHLGSTTLTYNPTSGERKRQWYLPYGAARWPSPGTLPTDYRFTGQRAESGLGAVYDYGARFYDAALGRFLSPDSIVPQPGDPQSLNRYAYARSNPLRYIDPTGHCASDYYTGRGCPSWMPDRVFGGLELVANLTVAKTAYAPAEDGQPSDLASLTDVADARWYQGAALSMVDAYDLADTMDECADGRCSGVRIALGLAPIIPGKAATKLFNHFTPIERLVPIARKVAGDIENMHWIPKEFHPGIQARWGNVGSKLLNFTDPLAKDFHKIAHGKWGTRLEEYNAQVRQWLMDPGNLNATLDDLLSFIEQKRLEYLEKYSEYLTGG